MVTVPEKRVSTRDQHITVIEYVPNEMPLESGAGPSVFPQRGPHLITNTMARFDMEPESNKLIIYGAGSVLQ